MSRDQRVQDNWALLYAQRLAFKHKVPLFVCFCLVPKFLEATIRQYGFMLRGLQEVEKELQTLKIPFFLLLGEAKDAIPSLVDELGVGQVVCDFSPLRVPLQWLNKLREKLKSSISITQVDAHNIVPCWEASTKLETAARTIRPKIQGKLSSFLTEFPPVVQHKHHPPSNTFKRIDWSAADASLQIDRSVHEVDWATAGTAAGISMLESFCNQRLTIYSQSRNDPNQQALSNLSPWFHFGQLSVQRAVLQVRQYRGKHKDSVDAFIEEAVIRRELSDNFCFYNQEGYDSLKGAASWAQETLHLHTKDKREYLYSRKELEEGKTHDDLWNAAQLQMVREGKMHGYLRMYWAKKILEWTETPERALKEAIYLNDKYELDGRDPNGFVGCMWSICGIHDQGWRERPIFGKIRFMNYKGCQRKFNIPGFVKKYQSPKKTSK